MMLCKKCGAPVIFDSYAGTYYCETCCKMLEDDQIVREEDYDKSDDHIEEYDGEPLSTASLVLLYIFMWIPIFNIMILWWIMGSDVKEEYKKQFCTQLVINVLAVLVLMVAFVPWAYNRKHLIYEQAHKIVMSIDKAFMSTGPKMDLPEFKYVDYENVLAHKAEELPDYELTQEPSTSHIIFDKCVLTGDTVSSIVKGMDESAIVLVQTKDVARRYGKEAYRNVGLLIEDVTYNSSASNYIFKGDIPDVAEYYENDYGEQISVPLDDLFNSKYIYYLNPDRYYECTILYNSSNEVVGFVFKEVSIK